MTPEQRRRAGAAVADRIEYLQTTAAEIARNAGVDPETVRRLIRGERWPRNDNLERVCTSLGWPQGEIDRRAIGVDDRKAAASLTTGALMSELCHRYVQHG